MSNGRLSAEMSAEAANQEKILQASFRYYTRGPEVGGAQMLGDRIRLPWNSIGLVLVLLGLILFFSAFSDYFFSSVTFRTLLNQIPALTVIAVGMTYVLLISGIDLSVGSVMALSAAVAGVLLTQFGFALWAAVAAAMLTGVICGGINGYISAHWYIPSFVVTLGMLEIARGGAISSPVLKHNMLEMLLACLEQRYRDRGIGFISHCFASCFSSAVCTSKPFWPLHGCYWDERGSCSPFRYRYRKWKILVFVLAVCLLDSAVCFSWATYNQRTPMQASGWNCLQSRSGYWGN